MQPECAAYDCLVTITDERQPAVSSLPDLQGRPLTALLSLHEVILDEVIQRVIPEPAGTPDTSFNSAI